MEFFKLWNRIAQKLSCNGIFCFYSFVGLINVFDICKKQKKLIRSFLATLIEVVKYLAFAFKSDESMFLIWRHIKTNYTRDINHMYS